MSIILSGGTLSSHLVTSADPNVRAATATSVRSTTTTLRAGMTFAAWAPAAPEISLAPRFNAAKRPTAKSSIH